MDPGARSRRPGCHGQHDDLSRVHRQRHRPGRGDRRDRPSPERIDSRILDVDSRASPIRPIANPPEPDEFRDATGVRLRADPGQHGCRAVTGDGGGRAEADHPDLCPSTRRVRSRERETDQQKRKPQQHRVVPGEEVVVGNVLETRSGASPSATAATPGITVAMTTAISDEQQSRGEEQRHQQGEHDAVVVQDDRDLASERLQTARREGRAGGRAAGSRRPDPSSRRPAAETLRRSSGRGRCRRAWRTVSTTYRRRSVRSGRGGGWRGRRTSRAPRCPAQGRVRRCAGRLLLRPGGSVA